MDKIALYIPRPGISHKMIQLGYVDTLRHLGWKVYCCDPKTKFGCCKMIKDYGVRLIITHSKYGIRQLPIDIINNNNVMVFVEAIPLNNDGLTIDGPYEMAHNDEPDIIQNIKLVTTYTKIEPHLWTTHMPMWGKCNLVHLPVAGNIIRAVPPTCSILTDVAMVANFAHRSGIMMHLIEPLFKRLEILGYSYQAFGDEIWAKAGLNYNGSLEGDFNKLAHIYATASVCPNVHTEQQIKLLAYINERSFTIPLCGGIQVSDNQLASKYLGEYCEIANTVTDFIDRVIRLIIDQHNRSEKIMASVEYVANNHTYFNRLFNLFHIAGLRKFANEIKTIGQRVATKHCLGINARLSAKERNVQYEQQVIGAA